MLAVASISARLLAEAAAEEGHRVIALDLFGDDDTRRVSSQWVRIGGPSPMRIDGERLLDALAALNQRGGVEGWLIGSGFEGQTELLAEASALLPLFGTAANDVKRVRDPQTFFAALDRLGIAYPAVQHSALTDATGWLVKDAGGCGGWQVRAAPAGKDLPLGHYFQREVRGTPMSATFVANGRDAIVLGINQQLVQRIGARPFVFCGVVGPVPMDAALTQRVERAVRALAAEFELRGLGSLDFMHDGDAFAVLEVNPRPPASVALYRNQRPIEAHLRACREGVLPERAPQALTHGTEIVFARHTLRLSGAAARELAAQPQCHDLPRAGSVFAAGDPLCSVSAQGGSALDVVAQLAGRRDAVLNRLER
jgi:predicted ATP-grasp superfamily ATP-dependent carboligase